MRPVRLLAGWLCMAIGFAVVVLLGLGVLDPTTGTNATSLAPVLVAMLPSVSFGIAIFAVGVWLISTGKSK